MIKTMRVSVGDAIIRFLDKQYVSFDGKETKFVDGVFTIFGHGCVLGIGEALALGDHTLKTYQGKNEQGMAHVAISYAKQNNRRKIIPCISSIGPGAANMVTAAAVATVNNIPLLLFPGDTFATRRPDPVLQQLEQPSDLNITTNDAFKPVVKFFDRITRPEMLESALLNAMRVLVDPASTGAVCIALPQDVQGESYDFPLDLFEKRVHIIKRATPTDEEIKEASNLIKSSKKPLVIVGGGARYSEAGDVIGDFCKEYNIPFAETQAGKSTISAENPMYLGGIGVTGNLAANMIAKDADLIIGIGTRFSDFTTSSKTLFKDAKVLTINTSDFHASKLNSQKIVGDARKSMEMLFGALMGYKSGYTNEVTKAQNAWKKEYERLASIEYSEDLKPEVCDMTESTMKDFCKATNARLTQTKALALIRKHIEEDAIVVGASGSLPGCMQRMWDTKSLYSYNMEYGYSCMGYEIAGALGSKLANPKASAYAFAGDGSFLMLHSELVTAIQEKSKITILLFDNGGFGCINNLQMSSGISSLATEFRYGAKSLTPFLKISYADVARGYGCKTYAATTEEELIEALEAQKEDKEVVLIDIKVLPKTMTGGYEGGFWQTGLTHEPRNPKQKKALLELKSKIKD
jgi:3D-(3,5/4)-trihydroxycyclohexane-1,2-dione acylhydrolase (decyclizing)